MTIGDLFDLIRKKCPQAFRIVSIEIFKNRRIAIDANLWMYKIMSSAHKSVVYTTDIANHEVDRNKVITNWLSKALEFACRWMMYGITPIFVFDGRPHPEKDETRKKRSETKNKSREHLEEKRSQIQNIDPLERHPDNPLIQEYRKMLFNAIHISSDDIETLKNLFTGIGIPCLTAMADAEALCSILCKEGKVAAVYSEDGDNLAYGCPILITEFLGTVNKYELVTISMQEILDEFKMDQETFTDLCIMLGVISMKIYLK